MRRHGSTLARVGLGLTACAMLASRAAPASADATPSVDVRSWSPSVDPRANLVLEPPSSPGPWSFDTSAFLHYENDPVLLRGPTRAVSAHPLENALGLDLLASLGLGNRALVGIRAPAMLAEQGTGGLSTEVVSSGAVPAAALGDLALDAKGTLLGNDLGGFGLAALGELTLPTGTRTSFMSDRDPTVTVRALADVSLLVASLQASIGYTLRTGHVEWPSGAGGLTFGNEIPWTLGFVVRPALLHPIDPDGRHSWEVALHGALPGGPVVPFSNAALSPLLLALSDRVAFGHFRDGFVLAGVDIGLDDAVGVPSIRATVGIGWRFGSHDRDGDGIADDVDQCPTIAEDFDGFEDVDGCPEADNDDDGVVDREDACPNVKGGRSPDPRKKGCPLEGASPP